MPIRRLEITVTEDVFDRVDRARGDVPRAAWVKRAILAMLVIVEDGALEKAPAGVASRSVDAGSSPGAGSTPVQSSSPRASKNQRLEKARDALGSDAPAPPKIAPRHWAS